MPFSSSDFHPDSVGPGPRTLAGKRGSFAGGGRDCAGSGRAGGSPPNHTEAVQESPGFLRRIWTALGGALKRGILGKSSHAYMKQFTGSDEYWDNAIAAQRDWAEKQPPKPDPGREYEPVHGWSKRQLDDYLTRNPTYVPMYEAELQKHRQASPHSVTRNSG